MAPQDLWPALPEDGSTVRVRIAAIDDGSTGPRDLVPGPRRGRNQRSATANPPGATVTVTLAAPVAVAVRRPNRS